MSSTTLFRVAGALYLLFPIGHTQMALDVVHPALQPLGGAIGAYASKVSWSQANGYFLATALMCFNWAEKGVGEGLDRYLLGVVVATHVGAGLMYARRKVFGPALGYWITSLLMGIAAFKGVEN